MPPTEPLPPHVAVVGGGITGLATAWYLRKLVGGACRITIVEASARLGGKIRTEELAGLPVEAGPDTFLARVPRAAELCRELGLGDDLLPPATGAAYVWHGGRLHRLPPATVLGVPITARTLASTSLLSPRGAARAALDVVLPRRVLPSDPTVAEVVGARLGREVLERMVEPLVGGINAGRADRLSLRSTAPRLAEAADGHRSLILGLRDSQVAGAGAGAGAGPVFLGVKGGMERVVERLSSSLDGAEVRSGTAVRSISGVAGPGGGRWQLDCDPGPPVTADAVVVTVPSTVAARLLAGAPVAAAELGRIRYASVAVTTLAYRRSAVPLRLDGSGFLVPRVTGRLLTACTWSSSKWPHLGDTDLVLLRASAGRDGDERAVSLGDDSLVDAVHAELAEMVGAIERPATSRVDRWIDAFPQYEPGHERRVTRIESDVAANLPGVFVAGSAYRGPGIAACVQQAYETAGRLAAHLDRARSAAGGGNMAG